VSSEQDKAEEQEPTPLVPSPVPRSAHIDKDIDAEGGAGSDEAAAVTTEPAERRPRRPARLAGRMALALASAVALAVSGYAYIAKDNLQSTVPTTDALTPPGEPAPPADDGGTDILLVGSDARTDAQGNPLPARLLKDLRTEDKAGINTDTIIVLRIPDKGGKPSAISIPRDAWVDVPGRGKAKINSAYGVAKANFAAQKRREGNTDQTAIERDSDQAGRRALVQTVQDFIQLRIDHYAEVNLLGFYLLTEALGGVKVCLNHATSDSDSGADFRAGPQTVSGGEALSFVRQRKNLPRGDLDRIVRQQSFLSSALQQVLSAGTLTSPSTLGKLVDAVHRSIVTDPGLDLLGFANQAKEIVSGDLTFVTIPVVNINGRSEDGQQSIVEVDPVAVRQFVAGLVGTEPSATPSATAGGGGSSGGAAVYEMPSAGVACVN
jgi:LCP family protein required for cell wall assembly